MLRQLSLESLEGDPAAVGRGGRRQRLARHAQLVAASAGAEQVAGRGQRVPRHRQLLLPGDGEILFMGDTPKTSARFLLLLLNEGPSIPLSESHVLKIRKIGAFITFTISYHSSIWCTVLIYPPLSPSKGIR